MFQLILGVGRVFLRKPPLRFPDKTSHPSALRPCLLPGGDAPTTSSLPSTAPTILRLPPPSHARPTSPPSLLSRLERFPLLITSPSLHPLVPTDVVLKIVIFLLISL
jgi:hypothetical protein